MKNGAARRLTGQLPPRKELSVAEAAVKDALRIFRESPGDMRVAVVGPFPPVEKIQAS